ncbi:MAG: YccF domain-containing protein [Selenomonadaceae bacterium]|nr:YccF domain-containing protein [Selenomonadaceae bacterium]
MSFIGNIIWFIFGGIIGGLSWILVGILWSVTVIGLPIGLQCFKLAKLTFFPFGKEVIYSDSSVSFLVNILWLIFGGFELALGFATMGLFFCVTIIGVPFGFQCFKLAKLALMPFGAKVR